MQNTFELIARALVVHRGKILLCHGKGAAHYFLPGGHVEFGERAVDALKREMKEELGVAAKVGRFIGAAENVFARSGPPGASLAKGGKKIHELNLIFLATLNKKPTGSREDHIEFSWKDFVNISRLPLFPRALRNSLNTWRTRKAPFFASDVPR